MGADPESTRARLLSRGLLALGVLALAVETIVYVRATEFYGPGAYYLRSLANHGAASYWNQFILHGSYYPPFYYAFLWLGKLVVGLSFGGHLALGLVFPFGGALYIYALGRRMAPDPLPGAAALFFLLLPGVAIFTKTLVIENPLLLFVPAIVYHTAASERLTVRGHALALGAFCGLAVLTKWTFGAYVLGAMGTALVLAPPRERGGRRGAVRAINVLLALAAFLAIGAPWYLAAFDPAVFRMTASNDPTFPVYSYPGQIAADLSNLRMLAGAWTLPAAAIAFVAAAAASRRFVLAVVGLPLLVGVPLAVFAIPIHLEARYMLPVLPVLSVLVLFPWRETAPRILRALVVVGLVAAVACDHLAAVVPPEDGDYGTTEQILYVNHVRGRLFWGSAQTGAIYDRMLARLDETGGGSAKVVAHPLWENYHCAYTTMSLFRKQDPARERIEVVGLNASQYAVFHRMLRDREPEFILVNCGPTGDCADRQSDFDLPRYRTLLERPYVDQFSGRSSEPFSPDDARADLSYLTEHYRVLGRFGSDRQGRVVLYARKQDAP